MSYYTRGVGATTKYIAAHVVHIKELNNMIQHTLSKSLCRLLRVACSRIA